MIGPICKEIAEMEKSLEYEETMNAEEKRQEGVCNSEVLGDPVECIVAWDIRLSEDLRKIRPLIEPLTRMQYPNPFLKWVEAFRTEAENFNKKARMKAA